MGKYALYGETQDAKGVCARDAASARLPRVLDPCCSKAGPGEQSAHEAVALPHVADALVDPAIRKSEVTHIRRYPTVRQLAGEPVEQLGIEGAKRPGALALGDYLIDDVVALFPLAQELVNELWWILEVGGHDHGGVAGRAFEACCDAPVHTKVPR